MSDDIIIIILHNVQGPEAQSLHRTENLACRSPEVKAGTLAWVGSSCWLSLFLTCGEAHFSVHSNRCLCCSSRSGPRSSASWPKEPEWAVWPLCILRFSLQLATNLAQMFSLPVHHGTQVQSKFAYLVIRLKKNPNNLSSSNLFSICLSIHPWTCV